MKVRMLSNEEVEIAGRNAMKAGNELIFQLANEVMQIRSKVRSGEIQAESMVSAKDGRGRVRMSWGNEEAYLDLDIATGLGQSIIEAACAARIDALFSAVLVNDLGLPPDAASNMLRAVRGARRIEDKGVM